MKLSDVQNTPVIQLRNGQTATEIQLNNLREKGLGLISYGLREGDTFEFPSTADDVKLMERTINERATEVLILGLKNGEPAWFSIGNLRRRDYKMKPVHPVAEALHMEENDEQRIKKCLGKTIIASGEVEYEEYIFNNGVRTDDRRKRTTAKLQFYA